MTKSSRKQAHRSAIERRFPFWSRIDNYMQDISRKEEDRINARSRYADEHSRPRGFTGEWPVLNTSLHGVCCDLGLHIPGEIKQRITKMKKAGGKGKIRVLDLGCGTAEALKEIKMLFKGKVETVGNLTGRISEADYSGVDRLIEGPFLTTKIDGAFDIIYSHYGAFQYTAHHFLSLQKAFGLLKEGGVAALDFGGDFGIPQMRQIETFLAQNGVTKYELHARSLIFRKPKKKLPR